MVRQVIDIGRVCQQIRAAIETDANGKGVGLGGSMNGNTGRPCV
jgi:hypothetical protein